MKKYIQPTIKTMQVKTNAYMQTMVLSDSEGFGGPMGNESTFDENDYKFSSPKSVWE